MLKQGTEDMLVNAGKYSCYYLCLCYLANKPFNSDDVDYLVSKRLLLSDFTVQDAGAILSYLSGKKYIHSKESITYKPKSGELIIGCWELAPYNHFCVVDPKDFKKIIYNPLMVSNTVNKGKLVSLRVLRKS